MICNSSGIAPFRGFLQHQHHDLSGENPSTSPFNKMILFFGARHRSVDYIFKDEIEHLASECTLTAVFEAFSRDDTQKVYVQDILETKRDMVNRILFENKGTLYLCGSNAMIKDCLNVVRELFRQIKGSEEEGDILFEQTKQNDQIIFEGWG
jgi:sulfite reductase alpha subunit-like flavoprotein